MNNEMVDFFNINPLHGISRIDHKATHSWWVRLKYVNRIPQIQKSFPDKRFGDSEKALIAAKVYRDEQASLNNIIPMKRLSWKNRTRKERRIIQKEYGRKLVHVGTGSGAAKKAYDLDMCKVTCFKISTGRQNSVLVNNGGWHTPEYEDFDFKHDISNAQYKNIRNLVEHYARYFSEAEKSEMVGDIMIKISTGMIKNIKNMSLLVHKWVSLRQLRKNCPYKIEIPIDISGNTVKMDKY